MKTCMQCLQPSLSDISSFYRFQSMDSVQELSITIFYFREDGTFPQDMWVIHPCDSVCRQCLYKRLGMSFFIFFLSQKKRIENL